MNFKEGDLVRLKGSTHSEGTIAHVVLDGGVYVRPHYSRGLVWYPRPADQLDHDTVENAVTHYPRLAAERADAARTVKP